MKNFVRTVFSVAVALLPLVVAGCGGTARDPSLEVDAVVTKGLIEKFGSILVNGIEFKTAGALLYLRDTKTGTVLQTEAQVKELLHMGMVVTVKGLVNKDRTTGTAHEVEFRNCLTGRIEEKGADFIIVMGQKIMVDDSIRSLLATLQPGDVVEICGLPNASGQLNATFLEKMDNVSEFEIKGYVKLIDGSSASFILLLAPNAPSGITVNLGAGATLPAEGSFIEVRTGTPAVNGAITVTELVVQDVLRPAENQRVSFEGFPVSGTVDDFDLNGQRVRTNTQTVFLNGGKSDFVLAGKLEVQGTVVGGILIAEKITFKAVTGSLSNGMI